MQIIETTAPISIEDLKKYFTNKDTFYIIDCSKSQMKGSKLLTYLSNLDLPVDIKEPDLELLKEYFNSISLVNINSLENIAINVLLQYKGLVKENNYKDFIEQNKEIISKWSDKLDSLTIFNAYIVNSDLLRDYAKTFPKDDTKDLTGVNFLSLLKHERFYSFYNKLNKNVKFYTHYFDDYMFRGKNLFSFWGNLNNPMFLLTLAVSQGKNKDYITAKKQDKELIKNVTSI
jgi:hypothetical protein